ncbi:MAG: quinolinate synthase NadA [Ignavibacteria bacterium]
MQETKKILDKISEFKKEKNAVILAHNYQIGDVQDIADYVGDSLGLSQIAAETDADMIVFCGVHFMAETASIISPDKKVLIPDPEAGCSLADSINLEQLKEWKKNNLDAVVVSYVNTTAEIKTESDYCCTSSNAVQVVNSIPDDKEILFLPDKFLGQYTAAVTGRNIKIWEGACHIHEKIGTLQFDDAKEQFPEAEFLVHPECGCSTSCMLKSHLNPEANIYIFSTGGMIDYVGKSKSKDFIIATEVGILHRMKKLNPEKNFYPASEESVCEYMKMITLENLYDSFKYEQFEVKVPKEIADKARIPIQRMLEIV